MLFARNDVTHDLRVCVGLREGEKHCVVVVFKLYVKDERIVVEVFLLFKLLGLFVLCLFRALICLGVLLLPKIVFNFLVLVGVLACHHDIFAPSRHLGLYEGELFRGHRLPISVAFAFEHDPLLELLLAVALAAREPWLREVHDVEGVFLVGLRVLHPEVEPLLVTLRVRVYLHVKVIV